MAKKRKFSGRPTELDDELCLKIRDFILSGKTMKEVAKLTKIPYDTIQGWITRNYNGFADKSMLYKAEYRLKRAEEFGDELMSSKSKAKEIIKLKQKEAEFVRETLGKKLYSKRNEITGEDGAPVKIDVSTMLDKVYGPNSAGEMHTDS